jgi:hypothetical protein
MFKYLSQLFSEVVFLDSFWSWHVFPVDRDILCWMVVNLVGSPVQDAHQVQYKQIKPQEAPLPTKGP